jgi:hypothetical protein
MTKPRVSFTVFLSLLLLVLVGPPLPGRERLVSMGQGHQSSHQDEATDNSKDKPKDPCAKLADVKGLALGIAKKCLAGGGSSGIAKADFNRDGFADLAVGVPGEETPAGQPSAGAVNVIYGSKDGLTTDLDAVLPPQFLSQNTSHNGSEVPQFSEAGDGFGSAVVGGDFNDDGFSDLAIGAPFEHFAHLATPTVHGIAAHGSVTVIYGSSVGLTTDPNLRVLPAQIFSTGLHCGIPLAADTDNEVPIIGGLFFGSSLAWGDFNGDGVGDLAVGSPDDRVPIGGACQSAGSVSILFGSRDAGLTDIDRQLFTQDSQNVNDSAEEGDLFGFALAAGDFNGDKTTDLAIGVWGEDVTGADTQCFAQIVDAGAVEVLLGISGSGLSATGDRFFDERDLFNLRLAGSGVAAALDRFGSSMAAGDFDGDGLDELAIGAHNRNSRGLADSGVVFVRSFGGANSGVQVWDQTAIFGSEFFNFTGSPSEAGDRFGYALAAGDFNADGRKDLAIGAPFEDVLVDRGGNTSEHVSNAGEVNVIYGSPAGLSTAGQAPQQFHQDTININDSVESGDEFGKSLTAWNFGRNETRQACGTFGCFTIPVITADLAIGVPFEDVGSAVNAGAVNVIYGCTTCFANFAGLTSVADQFWTQGLSAPGPGGPAWGSPEAGDHFGATMY